MTTSATFILELEPELRDDFMAAAEASHRLPSQIVCELMREFVQRQRNYDDSSAFLRRKVEQARLSARAGQGRPNEAVEADFAARRARLSAQR